MKKILLILTLMLTLSATISAQSYTREGNTFISSTGERTKQEATKTKFTWKDSKGKEYAIHVSSKGAAFVFKVSAKSGKEYKQYLGADISQQICKELKLEYKPKNKTK